ncbi:hypothetical protein GQC19_003633, partial [Salmonella enterica]|nr:hypothetical protein [Salmonella enterica]
SNDKFFISGVRELIAEKGFHDVYELMLFDAPPFIYILNSHWFFSREFKDPFTALLCCSDFLYPRKIDFNNFIKVFRNNKLNSKMHISEGITVSELKVLHAIYNGDKDKVIAKRFSCLEKTINSHKIKVLHKLKVKNSRALYFLIDFWKTSWPTLSNLDDGVHFYPCINTTSCESGQQ